MNANKWQACRLLVQSRTCLKKISLPAIFLEACGKLGPGSWNSLLAFSQFALVPNGSSEILVLPPIWFKAPREQEPASVLFTTLFVAQLLAYNRCSVNEWSKYVAQSYNYVRQRVGHDLATEQQQQQNAHIHMRYYIYIYIYNRLLLLGRKAITNLDSILKSTSPTKVHIVKAIFFTVVLYRYES